jgi:hypothetical protein
MQCQEADRKAPAMNGTASATSGVRWYSEDHHGENLNAFLRILTRSVNTADRSGLAIVICSILHQSYRSITLGAYASTSPRHLRKVSRGERKSMIHDPGGMSAPYSRRPVYCDSISLGSQ